MPTTKAGKVRHLLRDGKAIIVSHTPFTIRLTYETSHYTQSVSLGVNAGTKHIGLSATTGQKELFAAEIDLRTDIVDNLSTRREARRTRRSKRSMRYRAPRFLNRRASKSPGWLAPSVQQKVHSHVKAVQDICRLLPVTSVTVEVAQFDTQLLKNPGIAGEQYQQGPQLGFWNVREYVLFRDNHQCQHCHGKSKDRILNVHHIESRKTGGDSPDNLITLCETCHKAYHRGDVELKLKRSFRSLRDAAAMNIMRWTVYDRMKEELDFPVSLTYGYKTKYIRINAGLEKSNAVDARCISGNAQAIPTDRIFILKQLRRHNRKVMKSNLLKGGRRKRNQATRDIKGFRLFDIVIYNSIPAYVHGRRSSGFFHIKDIEGKILSNSVSYKLLKLKRHTNSYLFNIKKRQCPIPPTDESVGFLGQLS
jgi:hypothetical protein